MEPPGGVDRLGSGRGIVEISEHHPAPPRDDLAGLARREQHAGIAHDRHFELGHRTAAARRDQRDRVARAAHRDVAALGHAVTGDHHVEPQFVVHPLDQHRRNGRRAGHRHAQRRGVERSRRAFGEQRLVNGRCAGDEADPLGLDQADRLGDIERRHRHDRGAGEQRCDPPGLVAEGVEERVGNQVAVALTQIGDIRPVGEHRDHPVVRVHRPLGRAGGARSEDDVAEVGARQPGQRGIDRLIARASPSLQPLAPIAVEGDSRLEFGQVLAGEQRGVVGAEEIAHGEQQSAARAAQLVGRFASLEPGIERHDRRARGLRAQCGYDPFEQVRRPDRDPVALADPGSDERRGGGAGLAPQPGETHAAAGQDHRDGLAETPRGRSGGVGNSRRQLHHIPEKLDGPK